MGSEMCIRDRGYSVTSVAFGTFGYSVRSVPSVTAMYSVAFVTWITSTNFDYFRILPLFPSLQLLPVTQATSVACAGYLLSSRHHYFIITGTLVTSDTPVSLPVAFGHWVSSCDSITTVLSVTLVTPITPTKRNGRETARSEIRPIRNETKTTRNRHETKRM